MACPTAVFSRLAKASFESAFGSVFVMIAFPMDPTVVMRAFFPTDLRTTAPAAVSNEPTTPATVPTAAISGPASIAAAAKAAIE